MTSLTNQSTSYSQGMSFGKFRFLIDLKPPPGGKIRGASIYVPLSRYSKYSDIKILRPLWAKEDNGRERRQVIERMYKALTLPECLVSELQRLMSFDGPTRTRYAGLVEDLKMRGH